jgi:signal transduction histidine kinase
MERLGIRSAILVPLTGTDEAPLMVLMVASREPRGFQKGVTRAYLTACAQAGLALENLRLVEQGRELGMLAERQRLSHEIHDTLTQGFTSIIMHLAAARQALTASPDMAGRQADGRQAEQHLEQIGHTARESLSEARRLVWALRPETLEYASLPEALTRITGRFSEETGILATTSVTGEPDSLTPEAEVTLLRAAQEALANVRKHAKARRVAMTLSYMDDVIALDVRDDGVGFNTTRSPALPGSPDRSGLGLTGMHERVTELGGKLQVESSPGKGTTLAIELPVAAGEQAMRSVQGAEEKR